MFDLPKTCLMTYIGSYIHIWQGRWLVVYYVKYSNGRLSWGCLYLLHWKLQWNAFFPSLSVGIHTYYPCNKLLILLRLSFSYDNFGLNEAQWSKFQYFFSKQVCFSPKLCNWVLNLDLSPKFGQIFRVGIFNFWRPHLKSLAYSINIFDFQKQH